MSMNRFLSEWQHVMTRVLFPGQDVIGDEDDKWIFPSGWEMKLAGKSHCPHNLQRAPVRGPGAPADRWEGSVRRTVFFVSRQLCF